jgi:hypothetical protein
MLPSISPVAKGQRIADLVIGEGSAVVFGQQVAPVGITVGIVCNLLGVPGGVTPSGTLLFGVYLPKKGNGVVMYQQASPFGDKRQFLGIIPSP